MDNERNNGHSNPHWKAQDDFYTMKKDSSGLIRVPVRALNIIWGNDSRYWQWISLTEEDSKATGFEEGAVLLQVNWIEVTGKLSIDPSVAASNTTYEVLYIVKFQVDAFGWHSVPIKFKVRFNGEEKVRSEILQSYREREEEWHEIHGGEFTISNETAGPVLFGMFEVESDWWKGSMVLAGIKIKPKVSAESS